MREQSCRYTVQKKETKGKSLSLPLVIFFAVAALASVCLYGPAAAAAGAKPVVSSSGAAEAWPQSNLWPRFVVWQSKTDLYADPELKTKLKFAKDEEYRGSLNDGELVIALEKSKDGRSWKIDKLGDGKTGWAPAGPYLEVQLAYSTGDEVIVRRAPVNGRAEPILHLYKGDVVATIGYRDVPGNGRWYIFYTLGDYEAWTSGKFLKLCALPASESARLYRQAGVAAQENGGKLQSFGGVKVGDQASSLGPALKALSDGKYEGPAVLAEGENTFNFHLAETAEPSGYSKIVVTVENGKVTGIRLKNGIL
jgi:hypothetical protein